MVRIYISKTAGLLEKTAVKPYICKQLVDCNAQIDGL